MRTITRKVRQNAQTHFGYAKRFHESRNIQGPYFAAGDFCFVLIQCKSHKFSHSFRGPFRIMRVINEHLYVVRLAPGVEKVINICKMKPFPVNKYSSRKLPRSETEPGVDKDLQQRLDIPVQQVPDPESSSDEEIITSSHRPRRRPRQAPAVDNSTLDPETPEFIPSQIPGADPISTPQNLSDGDEVLTDPQDELSPPSQPRRAGLRPRASLRQPDYYQAGNAAVNMQSLISLWDSRS